MGLCPNKQFIPNRSLQLAMLAGAILIAASPAPAAVRVTPESVILDRPEAVEQLIVRDSAARTTGFRSEDPGIAAVDAAGRVTPRRDGRTLVFVKWAAGTIRVPVLVRGLKQPAPVSFARDVVPILTKAGCNSGKCHGKAEGQRGFKLSLFGFDAAADHDSVARAARRRRVSLAAPERSLVLLKATAAIPHGGGKRFAAGSREYRLALRWITEGARFDEKEALPSGIAVDPPTQVLAAGGSQQLRVVAVTPGGRGRCVTADARYESSDEPVAGVDAAGRVRAAGSTGEAAILVHYLGHVAVCRITVRRPGAKFVRPAEAGFIDRLTWDNLQRLGIPPAGPAGDAAFLRRVYLDTIGTLPTAAEARAFLQEAAGQGRAGSDARRRLVDRLLDRPEYADYWAMRWSDVLRVDRDVVRAEGAVAMTRWLRAQLARNRPYDEMVRDIILAQGDTAAEGPAALYRAFDKPEIAARSISQVFLGVRIECAQCHHHPSERWSQDDYFALAGFFTGVTRKTLPSGSEAILARDGADLAHPRTGKTIAARGLGAPAPGLADLPDRRSPLAAWMTAPENPYFARAIANRLWAHYFGRGLVDPVDDLRTTNPASNEPLLTALASHLRELKYDLKAFTRTLLNSNAYQLAGASGAGRAQDDRYFAHAIQKPLPAEVLLDAISQSTGTPEKFMGWPEGYRAIQVWDNRMQHYFFQVFGRPVRASVCECERSGEPSVSQALHLLNSPEIIAKIAAPVGTARRLSDGPLSHPQIVEELYLATVSRFPTGRERDLALASFKEAGAGPEARREATEDLLWALLNTKEFLYNH